MGVVSELSTEIESKPTRYRVVVLTSSHAVNVIGLSDLLQKETRRTEYSIRLVLKIVFV
jgi:hypothetical protein